LRVAGHVAHELDKLGGYLRPELDRGADSHSSTDQHRGQTTAQRRQIVGRGGHGSRPAGRLGEAEVGHLHHAVNGQQDIRRREMAMGKAAGVSGFQGGADIDGDPRRPGGRQRPAVDQHALQAAPSHQLGNDEPGPGVPSHPIDGRDVWVDETGRGPGLPLEPLKERPVLCQPPDRELEGDAAMLASVEPLQHLGEGAGTDGPQDLIAVAQQLHSYGHEPIAPGHVTTQRAHSVVPRPPNLTGSWELDTPERCAFGGSGLL
jgi:hypothetical protein